MRGVIPNDLERKNVEGKYVPKEEFLDFFIRNVAIPKIFSAKEKEKMNFNTRLCASLFATCVLEQSSSKKKGHLYIPNNNTLGWGVWKKYFPWGWTIMKKFWSENFTYRPDGFIIIQEGYGKKKAVLFSFPSLFGCLKSGLYIFENKLYHNKPRPILTFSDYEACWLGGRNPEGKKIWEENYLFFIKKLQEIN